MEQHKCKYCFYDIKRCSKSNKDNSKTYTPIQKPLTEADISKLLKRSLQKGMVEEGNIFPFVWQPILQWRTLKYCKVLDIDFLRLNINIHYLLQNVEDFFLQFPSVSPLFALFLFPSHSSLPPGLGADFW